MTITSSRFSVQFLRAAATISLLSGIGGMPGRGVLAEDRVDVDPAEDPAEAQRRQQIKQQATHWEQ